MSNWVQAKWESAPIRMFQKLREVIKRDFDTFQALSGDGQLRRDQFHWEQNDDRDVFGIIDEGDSAMHEVVRFCLDRAEGTITIEWWKVPAFGGSGQLQNSWHSPSGLGTNLVPMFIVEPQNNEAGAFRATAEELSRRSLEDFFAGWE